MNSVPHVKKCSKCGIWKETCDFYPDKSKRNGVSSRCRECHKLAVQERYNERRFEKLVYAKRYREAHRQTIIVYLRNYGKTDKKRASDKRYYLANKHRVSVQGRNYRQRNSSLIRTQRAEYRKRTSVARQVRNRLYEARKRNSDGRFTKREWESMCDWFGGICLCCGEAKSLTIDHVVPLVAGGRNDITNLQPLCGACNSSKCAKTIDYRDPAQLAAFLESLNE